MPHLQEQELEYLIAQISKVGLSIIRGARTRVKVLSKQVVVVVADSVEERIVDAAVTETTPSDLVQNAGKLRALLFDRLRMVHVLVPQVLNGRSEVAEEDFSSRQRHTDQMNIALLTDVALANLLSDFNVSTVCFFLLTRVKATADKTLTNGTEKQTTIQTELHVGGS